MSYLYRWSLLLALPQNGFGGKWNCCSFTAMEFMHSKEALIALLIQYRELFPGEQEGIKLYAGYLDRNDTGSLYTRKNFDGHITTSAFIIDRNKKEMLLLRHKSLNRWLQPGGHTEGDVSLVASALREAVEETGISAEELLYIAVHENSDVPFDIDSHYIPANPKKEEDGHYHHDQRYVFAYTGERNNTYNTDEATGMQWVSYDTLQTDDTFAAVIRKILATIN